MGAQFIFFYFFFPPFRRVFCLFVISFKSSRPKMSKASFEGEAEFNEVLFSVNSISKDKLVAVSKCALKFVKVRARLKSFFSFFHAKIFIYFRH